MFKKLFLIVLPYLVSVSANAASPEYEDCYGKAQDDNAVALCLKEENTRTLKQIQQIYLNLSKNEITGKWNNGNGLISGNLKDMYNSWLGYRNRYCSLYQTAMQNNFGSTSFNREKCLYSFNEDHLKLMQNVIVNANTKNKGSGIK